MTNTQTRRCGRHLVLVDIENIAGTPAPSPDAVRVAIADLEESVPGFRSAQKVWACSHRAAQTVAFAAFPDRQLWRSGPDGADRALLEVLDGERIAERYERVTVCSGDGIFADSIARLVGHGVTVEVTARRGHVSGRLRLAAHHVNYLDESGSALGTAS